MKIKRIISILLVLVMIIFVGCSKEDSESKGDKNITVGTPFFGEQIDPAIDYNGWQTMRYGVGETLIRISEDMESEPWLATDFKVINDTDWEFTIQEGVKFHSGEDMTIERIIDSIERTKELNDRAALMLRGIEFVSEDDKLIAKSEVLDPILPDKLSDPMFIIVDTKAAESNEDFHEKPICTGPFMVESFTPKEKAHIVPFEDYWDGKSNLTGVDYVLIGDSNTRMMTLQSGEIDVTMNLTSSALDLFKDSDDIEVDKSTSMKLIYLMMNSENEHLKDKRVREAINHAIDRDTMAEVTLNNTVVATQTPYPKNLPLGSEKIKGYEYDLDKAKSLLKEAGYEDKDGILVKGDKPLELRLVNYSSRAEIPIIAQYLQGELAKVGISLELVAYEQLPVDQYNAGDFDLGFDSYTIATSADPKKLLDLGFTSDASENFNNYFRSERIDEISKELLTESDIEKRYELGFEAQKIIVEETMNVFLGFSQNNIVRNKNLENFYIHPLDFYQMNVNVDIN